jgi:hypothetical protein
MVFHDFAYSSGLDYSAGPYLTGKATGKASWWLQRTPVATRIRLLFFWHMSVDRNATNAKILA